MTITAKTCTKCLATKPVSNFGKRGERDGQPLYRSRCKACQAESARGWYRENSQRARDGARRRRLQDDYGLTPEEYAALLEAQSGVCAICERPERATRDGEPVRLAVDHCHATGVIRGLLCTACNRSLGLFGEDVELMASATRYLERSKSEQH